jgi:excisionase family DNA binding protein
MQSKTMDKLPFYELTSIYDKLVEALKNRIPNTIEYQAVIDKMEIIEQLILKKKPDYFKQKDEDNFFENIKNENYTIKQVANIFNVSRQTIHRWLRANKIKRIKVGKLFYVSKKEVERIIKNGID